MNEGLYAWSFVANMDSLVVHTFSFRMKWMRRMPFSPTFSGFSRRGGNKVLRYPWITSIIRSESNLPNLQKDVLKLVVIFTFGEIFLTNMKAFIEELYFTNISRLYRDTVNAFRADSKLCQKSRKYKFRQFGSLGNNKSPNCN